MKKVMKKLLDKIGVKKFKKLSNNKGFSLIELLIVIAIMGVLAVIAFNMFGGVLSNSKKKADDQQAMNIQKALTMYCVESGDWGLAGEGGITGFATGTGSVVVANGNSYEKVVEFLLSEVEYKLEKYGPMLSPKDIDAIQNATVNIEAFAPQWTPASGGKNEGYAIVVDAVKQNVSVKPTATSGAGIILR